MEVRKPWKERRLGDVATLQRGFDLPHRKRVFGSIPIVTSSGIDDYHNVARAKPPGVVTGRYGTIGEVFFVTTDYWPHNTSLYVRDFHGNNPKFVYFLLKTVNFGAHSGKSGVPGVNRNDLHEEHVLLPPTLAEQEAIATALSDADAWIESLEQLIAKKRQIKQGAMQVLLTGKRRLPGFSGAWEVKRLGDVADVKTGPFGSSLHERDYVLDGTPIITVEHLGEMGVVHANLPRVSQKDHLRLTAYTLELGDIVFSRVGSIDRNALIRDREVGWLFSGRLLRLRFDRNRTHPAFLSHYFHTEPFKERVRRVAVGQTMASLNTRIISGISIEIPVLAEQTAIATLLSDMDTEIAMLETKLSKARQIKQGMMQELLTGRIRLI